MRRSARAEPGNYRLASPPDPRFRAALLKVFAGHELYAAVKAGHVQLGAFERDRRAAEITLAEIEADPEGYRMTFTRRETP